MFTNNNSYLLLAEIESFNKEFETFKAEEQLTLDECQCSFVNSMDSSVTDQSSKSAFSKFDS